MPPSPSPASAGMNKIVVIWLVVAVAVVAVVGWWWMSRSEIASAPTRTPPVQTDADVNELDSINTNEDLNAEFQQIDQNLNNL